MRTIKSIKQVKKLITNLREQNIKVGFVPTMGALHEGHLSLIRQCVKENQYSIVSIFLNPLQFGENEDLKKYPRSIQNDIKLCEKTGVNLLFCPDNEDMYEDKKDIFIISEVFSGILCGNTRPGHFKGVLTVVSKLFNLIKPDTAYFGEKDYQQATLIKYMVNDLDFDINIKQCPTIREQSGLALSSRNVYLSEAEREKASNIYRSLLHVGNLIKSGRIRSVGEASHAVRLFILSSIDDVHIDYVEVLYDGTLEKAFSLDRDLRVLTAVKIANTRLIDNYRISI